MTFAYDFFRMTFSLVFLSFTLFFAYDLRVCLFAYDPVYDSANDSAIPPGTREAVRASLRMRPPQAQVAPEGGDLCVNAGVGCRRAAVGQHEDDGVLAPDDVACTAAR